MRKFALGIATAAVLLTAVPAMAQVGFFTGRHGVGVELGAPGPYYGNNYGGGYYDYYNGADSYYGRPNVVIGGHHWHHRGHWRH